MSRGFGAGGRGRCGRRRPRVGGLAAVGGSPVRGWGPRRALRGGWRCPSTPPALRGVRFTYGGRGLGRRASSGLACAPRRRGLWDGWCARRSRPAAADVVDALGVAGVGAPLVGAEGPRQEGKMGVRQGPERQRRRVPRPRPPPLHLFSPKISMECELTAHVEERRAMVWGRRGLAHKWFRLTRLTQRLWPRRLWDDANAACSRWVEGRVGVGQADTHDAIPACARWIDKWSLLRSTHFLSVMSA